MAWSDAARAAAARARKLRARVSVGGGVSVTRSALARQIRGQRHIHRTGMLGSTVKQSVRKHNKMIRKQAKAALKIDRWLKISGVQYRRLG